MISTIEELVAALASARNNALRIPNMLAGTIPTVVVTPDQRRYRVGVVSVEGKTRAEAVCEVHILSEKGR